MLVQRLVLAVMGVFPALSLAWVLKTLVDPGPDTVPVELASTRGLLALIAAGVALASLLAVGWGALGSDGARLAPARAAAVGLIGAFLALVLLYWVVATA